MEKRCAHSASVSWKELFQHKPYIQQLFFSPAFPSPLLAPLSSLALWKWNCYIITSYIYFKGHNMKSALLTNFSFTKHLLYISCIRYQKCIEDYYNSISMLHICPDEQDGRKIMPLGKKWLYCKWVVYTFNWTPKHFLLILLSTSFSCIFSLSLFVLYFALLVVLFLSSMHCQLLSLCCLSQVSPTLKNDKNNIK